MLLIETILRGLVLGLLISYLVQKHLQRISNIDEHCECDDSECDDSSRSTGFSIYGTELMPLITKVRKDHLAARPVKTDDCGYHNRLRDLIRQAIHEYAFFKHLRS